MLLRQRASSRRPRRARRFLVVALMAAGAACGGGDGDSRDDPSTPLAGWRRTEVIAHVDVKQYDDVATASSPGRVSWLGRDGGNTAALAYSTSVDGEAPTGVTLPSPLPAERLTPAAVATAENDQWVAVADARDEPGGTLTGLVAWRSAGTRAQPAPGDVLQAPDDTTIAFDTAGAARLGDTAVIAAATGPTPTPSDRPTGGPVPEDVVAWVATGDGSWQRSQPDLAIGTTLEAMRLTSDGERLVLAAVTSDARGVLWSSQDGQSWTPIEHDVPRDVTGIDLLTPVARGEVAVGWRRDDGGHSRTVAQILEADGLTDTGTVEPQDEADATGFVARGAAVDADGELVLVGIGYLDAPWSSPTLTTVPMVWIREDDAWVATQQTELVGRLDQGFRAVTSTRDDGLVAVITPNFGVDVELWEWSTPD